jgi:hypothetical protein
MLVAIVAGGCAGTSTKHEPQVDDTDKNLPKLFLPDTPYQLESADGTVRGYVFAVDEKPGHQVIRWFFRTDFSPVKEYVVVHRMLNSSAGVAPPKTAQEFADFARMLFEDGKYIYAKSNAHTYRQMYTAPGASKAHSIIPVPIPEGPDPPEPAGDPPRSGTARFDQLDGGGVGIIPGDPPRIGYLDPRWSQIRGAIGFAFAGPQLASNTEDWILGDEIFEKGLENMTIGPYREMKATLMGEAITDWAVVVVSSSYYRHAIPKQW